MESYLGVDPQFQLYHELMRNKVNDVLLVSSPYDAFIMEEDGSLAARIIHEFHGLNLSHPPRLRWAANAQAALHLLQIRRYDLVITMPQVNDMDAFALGQAVKKLYADVPVVLLAHALEAARLGPEAVSCGDVIDHFFAWSVNPSLFLAIIKNVEDHLNVAADTTTAKVRVLILVEDSPQYSSYFLPLIYKEVVQQTQEVLDDGLNEEHRLLKMRARPKILLATSYEHAWRLYDKFRDYLFCVISDGRFLRKCQVDPQAGLRLLTKMRADNPDLPLLMLSAEGTNQVAVEKIPAVFVDKNIEDLEGRIHDFFLSQLGFGDFVFRFPDGKLAGWAANFRSFEKALDEVPDASLLYHAKRNHFSNWVMARSEVELALQLRDVPLESFSSPEELRLFLRHCIHQLRQRRQQGVVVQYGGGDFDPEIIDFIKVGEGSIGGKARGLAFIANILPHCPDLPTDLTVRFPKTVVIAAQGFDNFVEENGLYHLYDEDDDLVIGDAFVRHPLPAWLEKDLRAIIRSLRGPLSVRSSSLLEDGHFRPYAGLYNTYMLTNNQADEDERFATLARAVKLVWASTWFAGPKAFSRSVRSSRERDSMAVILQQVVGRRYGDFFYPAMSGVAQSYNYYPLAPMAAEDGVVHLAMGLGKAVVEGETSLRFSPQFPQVLPQFSTVDDVLANGQRTFYAVDMRPAAGKLEVDDRQCLSKRQVSDAEDEEPVLQLASSYIAAEHRIRDGQHPGMRVLTFAAVLKYGLLPLPKVLTSLLRMSKEAMGCAAELEFAIDLDSDAAAESVFYLLQMRPMVVGQGQLQVVISEEERQTAICHSRQALGYGIHEILDIIYVKADAFDPAQTPAMAAQISQFNKKMVEAERPYLLVGPGRWGSADRWLGIPVQWQDISGVAAFIELQQEGFKADPSQGTHFFQNITSLAIPYVTVSQDEGHCDLDWFGRQERVAETKFVCQVRVKRGLVIKINPLESECVMFEQTPKLAVPVLSSSDFF